jgi:four helix bundle protein
MAGVRRHEDLVAWQLCVELDALVFEATEQGPGARDFKWRGQIRDAAGSAAPNIAEGFGRFGAREFARYLRIALASLKETSTHLVVGKGRGYIADPAHSRLAALCRAAADVTTRLLNAKLRQIAKEDAERAKTKRRKPGAPKRKPEADGK